MILHLPHIFLWSIDISSTRKFPYPNNPHQLAQGCWVIDGELGVLEGHSSGVKQDARCEPVAPCTLTLGSHFQIIKLLQTVFYHSDLLYYILLLISPLGQTMPSSLCSPSSARNTTPLPVSRTCCSVFDNAANNCDVQSCVPCRKRSRQLFKH